MSLYDNNPVTGGRGSVQSGQNALGIPQPGVDIYAQGQTPTSESQAVTKIIKSLSDQFPKKRFSTVTISLNSALNQQEFDFTGTSFRVQYVSNAQAQFQVQFNDITNGLIDMGTGNEISGTYFDKFFITCAAQPGYFVRVIIWSDVPSVRLSIK